MRLPRVSIRGVVPMSYSRHGWLTSFARGACASFLHSGFSPPLESRAFIDSVGVRLAVVGSRRRMRIRGNRCPRRTAVLLDTALCYRAVRQSLRE